MAGGRPPKYDPETIPDKVAAYIAHCRENTYAPTIDGLAVFLDIARDTIYDWEDKHEEFSYITRKLMTLQGAMLQQNGLVNNYNASITKLMLTKHKGHDRLPFTDKHDLTSDGKPLLIGLADNE